MKNTVTIKPNPSKQTRGHKILEVSFHNSSDDYKGCLISFDANHAEPVMRVYCIDKGINIYVDEKREENR